MISHEKLTQTARERERQLEERILFDLIQKAREKERQPEQRILIDRQAESRHSVFVFFAGPCGGTKKQRNNKKPKRKRKHNISNQKPKNR